MPYASRARPFNVRLLLDPPSLPRAHRTDAELRGLKYESRTQDELLERFGPAYIPGPWLSYENETQPGRLRLCQPDGLILDLVRGLVVIVEIKIKHTALAYFQLTNLYLPVVSALFNKVRSRL